MRRETIMKKSATSPLILAASMLFAAPVLAGPYSTLGIQNINNYYFVLSGVTNSADASCGSSGQNTCYPTLSPQNGTTAGGAQWINISSQTGWIDTEYDVCSGVAYPSGVATCQGYVGHVGVKFTTTSTIISGVTGGTAQLGPYQAGNPLTLTFTPTTPTPTPIPTPNSYASVPYRGVNLSGAEFDYAFQLPNPVDSVYFVDKGVSTVRLPFKWEYLLPNSTSPDPSQHIDFTQGNAKQYAALVNTLTSAGLYVVVDMHNYMRFPENATSGPVIGKDSPATQADYAQAWGDIATEFKANDHVIFDLMNEPHDMDTQLVFDNYKAAITAIRNANANNLVVLEGNNWSGLHSWTTATGTDGKTNAQVFTKAAINDNNYAINTHQYFDADFSGTSDCVADTSQSALLQRLGYADFANYMHTNQLRVIVTELGGFNNSGCANDINYFLTQIEQSDAYNPNAPSNGGFIGWIGWAGGHAYNGLPLDLGNDGGEKTTMTQGFASNGHLLPPSMQQAK